MNTEQKFMTDASLAGLAKWLRLLGFDTIVYDREAGRAMMRIAEQDKRILLTRRRDMMERQYSGRLSLMPEATIFEQLRFIISKYALKINSENLFRLCLGCNEILCPVGRDDVRDLVPQYVFENCEQYNRCGRCGKIYWQGTHVQNMLQFMKNNHINFDRET
jgi:uncharacterized protein